MNLLSITPTLDLHIVIKNFIANSQYYLAEQTLGYAKYFDLAKLKQSILRVLEMQQYDLAIKLINACKPISPQTEPQIKSLINIATISFFNAANNNVEFLLQLFYWYGEFPPPVIIPGSFSHAKIEDQKLSSLLVYACQYKTIDEIKMLLISLHFYVNQASHTSWIPELGNKTALIAACERGDLNIVELLIQYGANANMPNMSLSNPALYYLSPLLTSLFHGHDQITQRLLTAGAFIVPQANYLSFICDEELIRYFENSIVKTFLLSETFSFCIALAEKKHYRIAAILLANGMPISSVSNFMSMLSELSLIGDNNELLDLALHTAIVTDRRSSENKMYSLAELPDFLSV